MPTAAAPELEPRHPRACSGAQGLPGAALGHSSASRPALFSSPTKADGGKEQLTYESGEDDEEDEDEDFKPSDGSENEMETEMLDYV